MAEVKCLACNWQGDFGSTIRNTHEGQFPGDEQVDYACPKCGSDEFEQIS